MEKLTYNKDDLVKKMSQKLLFSNEDMKFMVDNFFEGARLGIEKEIMAKNRAISKQTYGIVNYVRDYNRPKANRRTLPVP